MRGHTAHDYDVNPYCLVTVTPETAATWLRRLDVLHAVEGAEHIGSVTFYDGLPQWFGSSLSLPQEDDDTQYMVQELLSLDSVLLDESQASLVNRICQDSDFRADCRQLCLVVEKSYKMRKHEGVYFTTYEKHCDVLLSTEIIYRWDLEKMAGKLYKKSRSK